jgi:hypothetical protein
VAGVCSTHETDSRGELTRLQRQTAAAATPKVHAGATGHTASATKPRQLDICVSLGRTPDVIQPLAKWRFFFNLSA